MLKKKISIELIIANILKVEIIQNMISQNALAKKLGINEQALTKSLNGRRILDLDLIMDICDELGISFVAVMKKAEEIYRLPEDANTLPKRKFLLERDGI